MGFKQHIGSASSKKVLNEYQCPNIKNWQYTLKMSRLRTINKEASESHLN